jgi:hypothetical protein
VAACGASADRDRQSLFAFALGPGWGPIESGFAGFPRGRRCVWERRVWERLGSGAFLVLEERYEAANPGATEPHLKVLTDLIPAGETRLNGPNGDFYRLFKLPAPILQNRAARERELNVEIDLQSSFRLRVPGVSEDGFGGIEVVLYFGALNPNLTFQGMDAEVRML